MTPSTQQPPQRHDWFDKWLSAGSINTTRLVEEGIARVEQHEEQTGARQRKRKAADEANHRAMVEAVVTNLARQTLTPEAGSLAILMGKLRRPRTRYDHPAFGDTFAGIISSLEAIGWLTFHPSPGMGEASAITPTFHLSSKVHEAGISLGDFLRSAGETIILSRKDKDGASDAGFTRELVDYPDTSTSTAFRGQMEGLNAFLKEADLSFLDDGRGSVDTFRREQRRYFTCRDDDPATSLDRGGRIFGGWWTNLNKHRRGSIRIEDEPIAILDYSSMFVRLAYAHLGLTPPDGDLYAIPGLIGHRRAAKLIVNCLMFDEHHRHRWPKVTAPDEIMPPGLTMPRVRAAILAHHPELGRCFGEGIGHQLMFTESTILIEVLQELKARKVVGLGLHDGLITSRPKAYEVKTVMEDVAQQITSAFIPVTVDTIPPALPSVSLSPTPYMRAISP
ncbi:hypothetical protein [Methylobacterium nigriterrae]|uniref:hypothetical protein n=1 Tax=Methylobacterium nigriterrae TaxID=3127512 RepID=UPI0030138CD0